MKKRYVVLACTISFLFGIGLMWRFSYLTVLTDAVYDRELAHMTEKAMVMVLLQKKDYDFAEEVLEIGLKNDKAALKSFPEERLSKKTLGHLDRLLEIHQEVDTKQDER